jgi:hypothetical protein
VWSVSNLDLSTLGDGEITVTISQTDSADNSSGDITASVVMDSAAPAVAVVSSSDVNSSNKSAFDFGGTCTDGDGNVSGHVTDGSNSISYTATCETDSTWSVSGLERSQ